MARYTRPSVSSDQEPDAGGIGQVAELVSYLVDMWFDDVEVLKDEARLVEALCAAAEEGQAKVLGQATHVFPNGAVTAALVLSQSHLTIHTWPEYRLANVDLLAYGFLNGSTIIDQVVRRLGATRTNATRVLRDVE